MRAASRRAPQRISERKGHIVMRNVLNINENWTFEKEGARETVTLPHSYNAVDGQETADYYRGVCTYTRALPVLQGRTYLEVGAANSVAAVSINGKRVGEHRGGYSLFRFDITPYLNAGGENTVSIAVDNRDQEDVYPSQADFTFYGGIYRDVNVITGLSDCHFSLTDGLCGVSAVPVKGDGADWEVHLTTHITGEKENVQAQYTLLDREGNTAGWLEADAAVQDAVLCVKNPVLWNGMQNPYLYTLRAVLMRDGEEIDAVETRIGFRTVTFDAEKGCFLNGEPIKLKGVSRHQDRYHRGNALTVREHREDLELIREVGANSIRLAHYQHDQHFYDLCDEMGFLVWAEVPVISRFSEKKQANARQQLTELITQNINHASIYCWGVENEITMGGAAKALEAGIRELNDLAHRLDPSRPTTCAQLMMCGIDSPMNGITDIQGYNLYFGWYLQTFNAIDKWLDRFHAQRPEIKLCLSEYGAEGILKYQSEHGEQGDYSETYQARFHEHYARAIAERDWLWGSYVWNMFDFGAANRDEGGVKGRNNKGLVTIDRKTRKDSFYVYKAFWSDEPFVHIGGERYVDRVAGTTTVPVYSNQPEVTLTVGGYTRTLACDHVVYFEDVPVALGENTATAVAGACTHTIRINGVETANPDYVLPGECKSFVRNWFDTDGGLREGYFSIEDRAGALLKSPEVQSLIRMALGGKKIPPVLLALAKPFKLKTLMKLVRMSSMADIANQYLQTIKK